MWWSPWLVACRPDPEPHGDRAGIDQPQDTAESGLVATGDTAGSERPGLVALPVLPDGAVWLSEIAASADAATGVPDRDRIELANGTDEDVDVGGSVLWALDADNQLPWTVPAGTRIPAQGFLVLTCTGGGGEEPSFRLAAEGGTVLWTYATDRGLVVDTAPFGTAGSSRFGDRWLPADETLGEPNPRAAFPSRVGTVRADGSISERSGLACDAGAPGTLVAEFDDLPAAAAWDVYWLSGLPVGDFRADASDLVDGAVTVEDAAGPLTETVRSARLRLEDPDAGPLRIRSSRRVCGPTDPAWIAADLVLVEVP